MSDQSDDSKRPPLSDDQRDHLERRALERARRRISGDVVPDSLDDSEGAYVGEFRAKNDPSSTMKSSPPIEISDSRGAKDVNQDSPSYGEARQGRIICPHCQTRGSVITYEKKVEVGGPSTWSVLLAPFSYGLSLLYGWKVSIYGTFASCSNCGTSWRIK
jgi:hypothetical protein